MHISDFDYLSDFCGEFGNGLAVLAYVIRRKSGEWSVFFNIQTSRLIVRFSKCQETFLLKKLKILDTHITT